MLTDADLKEAMDRRDELSKAIEASFTAEPAHDPKTGEVRGDAA
jgi:hypothetical protein